MKSFKKTISLMLALMLVLTMMTFTSCGSKDEGDLPSVEKDTFGSWIMTTEQEAVFEKLTVLTGTTGAYWQFNSHNCTLQLKATHYKNGKVINEGAFAQFAVDGDGYLYINYADSPTADMYDLMDTGDIDEENIATITATVSTDLGEDAINLQFGSDGVGSEDKQLSIQNSDDSWESSENIPIEYEKEFDIWAMNLDTKREVSMLDTVSATMDDWKKGECVIVSACFTEYTEEGEDATVVTDEELDFDEELSQEEGLEILKEVEEAEEAMKED